MSRRRFLFLLTFLVAIFLLILGRLFYLQVIRGEHYKKLAGRNFKRLRKIYPPRGDILDRGRKPLAYDIPEYILLLDAARLNKKELNTLEDNIKKLFGINLKDLLDEGVKSIEPIRLKSSLTQEDIDKYHANADRLPGVYIETVPKRFYPEGRLASHVLGYVGLPSERELKRYGDTIGANSYIGKLGLERSMNKVLLGELGEEEIIVNAVGSIVRKRKIKEARKGQSLVLTIDSRIQKIVEEVFEESGQVAGGVIVLKAKTGEVLALASFPRYDPNRVYEEWSKINKDKLKPLFNRVVRGRYPPASVLKIPVAYALLSTKTVGLHNRVLCKGSFFLGNRTFYCWNRSGHGNVDMIEAISESCDVYFYTNGYKLGLKNMKRFFRNFSYGEQIPFELPVKRGFIPTPRWKRERFKEPWYDGDTVNVSIGQGFMLSTLMEQTLMVMGIANDGVIYKPTLLREILNSDGKTVWKNKKSVFKLVRGDLEHFAVLRKAMREVVRSGTGQLAFSKIVDIAGKTGTAQVSRVSREKRKKLPWRLKDHAWFVCFAPYRDPLFVVGVLVEHGESGGRVAAPIARRILERIYIHKLHKEI